MRRLLTAATCVLVLGFCVAATAQQKQEGTFWLRYRCAAEPYRFTGFYGASRWGQTVPERPEGVELPAFKSGKPLFYRWETALDKSGGRWLAFDGPADGKPLDTLYVDTDGNGSLADEKAIHVEPDADGDAAFGLVRVVFNTDNGRVAYHLRVYLYVRDDSRRVYLVSCGWYEGDLQLDGKKRRVRLIDRNVNGAFNDASADGPSDVFALQQPQQFALLGVGRYFRESDDGPLWRLEVPPDGAFVRITPAGDVPMGTLTVPRDVVSLTVLGAGGEFKLTPKDGKAQLPAGKWRIESFTASRADGAGVKWKLEAASLGFGRNTFTVAAGGSTALGAVEPLRASAQVGTLPGTRYFSLALTTSLGGSVSLYRGGQLAPPPKLRLVNADKTYDRTYSFAYG